MKIRLTCSLPYTSSRSSSSTSAACSFKTASASLAAALVSAILDSLGVGLDLPELGADAVLPFGVGPGSPVLSIALAAAVLAPSSAFELAPGTSAPIESVFVLGATASAPIDSVLTGAGPPEAAGGAGFGAAAEDAGRLPSVPVGLFAIIGVGLDFCGCWGGWKLC